MRYLFYILIIFVLFGCSTDKSSEVRINPLPNFDAMWDYQHPDSTEIVFTEILKGLKDSTESSYDAEYHAELLTQIARTQGLQGKFNQAHTTLDSVKNMLTDNMKTAFIRYLLERGRVFNTSGEWEISKPILLKAYEFGVENDLDIYTLDAAHMMGIVEPPDKQLGWSLKALKIAEETSDTNCKGWLGPLYNNIGWTFHDLKEYDQALSFFQKGYDWRLSVDDEQGARIAKWAIGRCLRSLGKNDEALKSQKELLTELEEKKLPKDGYVFEELAEIYFVKGNNELAKKNFKLAYEELSKDRWLIANQPERLSRLKKLGNQ
ncbi:MAG: tetratricopeptide repeat protein [Candidatus Cloacimonadota bacterium]|nr:tetratricopeptide repeat protein [Candidatus Cloacimonadota bacterium]